MCKDLAKSHPINADWSEVEELKDRIKIMEATICNLQTENEVLKRHVPTETLLQITVNTVGYQTYSSEWAAFK